MSQKKKTTRRDLTAALDAIDANARTAGLSSCYTVEDAITDVKTALNAPPPPAPYDGATLSLEVKGQAVIHAESLAKHGKPEPRITDYGEVHYSRNNGETLICGKTIKHAKPLVGTNALSFCGACLTAMEIK